MAWLLLQGLHSLCCVTVVICVVHECAKLSCNYVMKWQ
jgi:hypothetical protein